MENKYKITIPEPCQENWDQMAPKGNGRFCMSCTKTVVDFTKMSREEIQNYFSSNQHKNICGKFKNTQLDEIAIQIPSQVFYSQTHYHKMFLLALFFAMGSTLFSCSDKEGNKQKINKVEIVENTSPATHTTMGIPPVPSGDMSDTPSSSVYSIVYSHKDLDVLPVPEKGMKKFNKFFTKNYSASEKPKTSDEKTSVLFVVEKDGSLTNFNLIHGTSRVNEEEVIRVLKKSPKWIPGKYKNRIVRSTYIFEIPF